MLAHIQRKELLRLSTQAALAVPKKTSTKELLGVHLEMNESLSMLTLTATNLEITIQASMGAVVEQSGSAIIDAKLLQTILTKLPGDTLDMEMDGQGQLIISSGAAGFRIGVLPGDRYPMPELPFPDDTVPVSKLVSLVRQTIFATSEEENATLMRCVKIVIGPDGLKGISTNGFCVMEAAGDKNCIGKTEMLVPAHAMKVLAAISKDSDVYEMGLTGKSVVFNSGTLIFCARLMEGRYPDVSPIFERFQVKYSVNLPAESLLSAIVSVSAVAEDISRIALTFGEHEVHVSAETKKGRAATPVKALVLSAPDRPFYYNYKALLKYLRLVSGNVTLDFDANGLLAIRAGATQYVQSPLRAPTQAAQTQKAA